MKIFLKECILLIKLWQKETVYIKITTICFAMAYMYHEWLIKNIVFTFAFINLKITKYMDSYHNKLSDSSLSSF